MISMDSSARRFQVMLDHEPHVAHEGETVIAVLLRAGKHVLRHTRAGRRPRNMFCGMGLCHECLVTVDGLRSVRACTMIVQPDMVIETAANR